MTTTSSNHQHQHLQLKEEGYDLNLEKQTMSTKPCKQQQHDDLYIIKRQNVAAVLSPLSSNASSPPSEPFLATTDQPFLPLLPLLASSPRPPSQNVLPVTNRESMPTPPPSASIMGMNDTSPNSRKQKSSSTYATTNTSTMTEMTRVQIKYCSAIIRNLKKHRDATPFLLPVDYIKLNLPDYPQIIKTPMDLTTIDRKLQLRQYVNVNQFINDIRLLFNNCYKFNGPESLVSVLCQNVESAFEKSLRQMPLSKKDTTSSSVSDSADTRHTPSPLHAISPIFRRKVDHSNALTTKAVSDPSRQRKHSHGNCDHSIKFKRRKIDLQLKFCGQAIRELKKNKYRTINYPFLYPVDVVALNIPDYHSIITHPMDISTIERNLANGEYNSAEDVERDVRLMFNNCYRYNPPTLPIHKMAKELEMVFDKKWKQLPNPESTPPPATNRETAHVYHDDNDESDVSADDNDDNDQITELERRIAIIAQQIESIKSTKKKSATPMVGTKRKTLNNKGKSSRPSSTTKETPTPANPRRRTSSTQKQPHRRSSSTTDPPPFTFDQKKELSESINNLTGDRLNTVVSIIQSSMPNLGGHGQDEIILDIDMLDGKTLHRLYEFITGKSLLQNQHHQPKKRKPMDKNRRLRALEESLRQINAGAHASSDSGSSGSESEDDSGTESE